MTKIISYPSGAFGNFLAYLLNYAITRERYVVNESVYDFSKSAVSIKTLTLAAVPSLPFKTRTL